VRITGAEVEEFAEFLEEAVDIDPIDIGGPPSLLGNMEARRG
jgi:hypothetical protein